MTTQLQHLHLERLGVTGRVLKLGMTLKCAMSWGQQGVRFSAGMQDTVRLRNSAKALNPSTLRLRR